MRQSRGEVNRHPGIDRTNVRLYVVGRRTNRVTKERGARRHDRFVLGLVVLTLMQYDFMVETGWPWPSGLALGTWGWLQVLNFVFFGLTMIAFAVGLHRSVAVGGRMSWVGPILFIVAGVAMVLLGFKVDNPSFTP
jgi:hypothetical protein